MISLLKRFFKPKPNPKPVEHVHDWLFQYNTGNPFDGKSQVFKCSGCDKWAVHHYGGKEKIILD